MRRAGRTRAMVMALPEGGATVVVHTARMRPYVMRMIADLRGPCVAHLVDVVSVATLQDTYRLRGAMWPLFVDHTVAEIAPREITETLRLLGARGYGMDGIEPVVTERTYSYNREIVGLSTFQVGDDSLQRDMSRLADRHLEDAMLHGVTFFGWDTGAGDRAVVRETNLWPTINRVHLGEMRVRLPEARWRELHYEARWPDVDDLGQREASARAESLLREWLSPEQAAQLDANSHFDVTGSDTGTRYRIKRGRARNVFALEADGTPAQGWCFAPAGNLAEGDVMLAQKIALETQEKKALKRANGFLPGPQHITLQDYSRMMFAPNQVVADVESGRQDDMPIERTEAPVESAAWTGRDDPTAVYVVLALLWVAPALVSLAFEAARLLG